MGNAVQQSRIAALQMLSNRKKMVTETSNIKLVRMLSSDGAKVIEANGYNGNGINISHLGAGVYVVAIITNDNKVYYEKVLKVE